MVDMSVFLPAKQRAAFDVRWNAWADPTRSLLEVRDAVLDEEPPRVTLGRKGVDDPKEQVTVVLGRDDEPATYLVDEENVRLSVREAAQTLYVSGPEMSGARAAALDGLEQSERMARRTPADRAPVKGEWSLVEKETITAAQARSLIAERAEAAPDGTSWHEDIKRSVDEIQQEYRVVPDPHIHAHEEQRLRKRDVVRDRTEKQWHREMSAYIRGDRESGPAAPSAQAAVNAAIRDEEAHGSLSSAREGERTPADRAEISNERAHEIVNSAREEKRMAGPDSDSVRERNRARMERATRCGIQRDESPGDGPQRAPKIGR